MVWVRRKHGLQLRIFVGHSAQHIDHSLPAHLPPNTLRVPNHLRHFFHHSLPHRGFVKLRDALNILQREMLSVDLHHCIRDRTRRRIRRVLLSERIHELRQLVRGKRASHHFFHSARHALIDVLPFFRSTGNIKQVPYGRLFGGIQFLCRRGRSLSRLHWSAGGRLLLGAARRRLRHCWARRKQHGGNQGISKSHFILLFKVRATALTYHYFGIVSNAAYRCNLSADSRLSRRFD